MAIATLAIATVSLGGIISLCNRSPLLGRPCTAGTSWRVQAPYMVRLVTGSWSYLGRSNFLIFNWVGGWDVLAVHQLPTSKLLGFSCKPQSISSSESCSCYRVQCLSGFFVVRPKNLKQLRRVLFANPLDPTSTGKYFSSHPALCLSWIKSSYFRVFFPWSWPVQGSPQKVLWVP